MVTTCDAVRYIPYNFCKCYIQGGPKNQTVFRSLLLPYMLTWNNVLLYRTVQYFIRSKAGVLYVTMLNILCAILV